MIPIYPLKKGIKTINGGGIKEDRSEMIGNV
jgi:hypothetical protein